MASEVNGPTTTYTWDDAGRLLSTDDGTVTTDHGWHQADRLLTAAPSDEGAHAFDYDVDGILRARTVAGARTRLLVDANRDFAQVLEERDEAGTVLARYVHGLRPIAQVRGSERRWYLHDGLGSTRALVDEAGQVTDTFEYEAFGEVLAGDTAGHLHAGERQEPALRLTYLRARWLGPRGRFLSRDPVETPFPYAYADNDPVNETDASGLLVGFGSSAVGTLQGLGLLLTGHLTTEDEDLVAPGFLFADSFLLRVWNNMKEGWDLAPGWDLAGETGVTQETIESDLGEADGKDIVVIIGHGDEDDKGHVMGMSDGHDDGDSITAQEMAAAANDGTPPWVVVFAGCKSDEIAAHVNANGGSPVTFGTTEKTRISHAVKAAKTLVQTLSYATQSDLRGAYASAQKAGSRELSGAAEFEVHQ